MCLVRTVESPTFCSKQSFSVHHVYYLVFKRELLTCLKPGKRPHFIKTPTEVTTSAAKHAKLCPLLVAAAGGITLKSLPVLLVIVNLSQCYPPPVAKSNLHFQIGTGHNDTVSRGLLKIETWLIKAGVKEYELRLVTRPTEM